MILAAKDHVGATVLVDGKEIARIQDGVSTGPSAGIRLARGTREVEVRHGGETLMRETINVDENSGELYAAVPPTPK